LCEKQYVLSVRLPGSANCLQWVLVLNNTGLSYLKLHKDDRILLGVPRAVVNFALLVYLHTTNSEVWRHNIFMEVKLIDEIDTKVSD
jgi:hypothetical protein